MTDDPDDGPDDDPECPICYGPMNAENAPWCLHDDHAFHMRCIVTDVGNLSWALVRSQNHITGIPLVRCPSCRQNYDCLEAPNSANSRLEFFCEVIKFLARKARDELTRNSGVSRPRLRRIAELLLLALRQLDRFLERNGLGERRREIMSLRTLWTATTYSEIVGGLTNTNREEFEHSRDLLLQFCDNFGVSRPSSPIGTPRPPSSTGTQWSPSSTERSPSLIDTGPHVRFSDPSIHEAYPSPVYPDELGIGAGRTHQGYEYNHKYYVIPTTEGEPLKELLWFRKVGGTGRRNNRQPGYQLILLTPRGRNQIPIISTAPSSRYGGQELILDFSRWCFRRDQAAEFQLDRNTSTLGPINQLKILNYWFVARDETQARRATNSPVQFVQVHFGHNNIPWSPTAGKIFLLTTLKRKYRQFDGILDNFTSRYSIPRAPPPGNPRATPPETPRARSGNPRDSRSSRELERRLEDAIGRIQELEDEIDLLRD